MTEHGKASGFFTEVELPSMGVTVRIRKVDAKVITQSAAGLLLGGAHAQVGAENAAEGGKLLRALMEGSDRPDDATLQDAALVIELSRLANKRMIEQALREPRFADLMALYESDGSDDDLGMGDDYTVLLDGIMRHAGVKAVTGVDAAAAERFPEGDSPDAGRGGQEVRKAAKRTAQPVA